MTAGDYLATTPGSICIDDARMRGTIVVQE